MLILCHQFGFAFFFINNYLYKFWYITEKSKVSGGRSPSLLKTKKSIQRAMLKLSVLRPRRKSEVRVFRVNL